MLGRLGPVELIIILVIVLLIFGVGRLSKISGELGSSIREFRKGLQGDETKPAEIKEGPKEPPEGGTAG
jgi:sec-independent protein translocase protein TatA